MSQKSIWSFAQNKFSRGSLSQTLSGPTKMFEINNVQDASVVKVLGSESFEVE